MSMTEASPMSDPQVSAMLDKLREISAEVKQIDAEIGDSGTGPVAQRNRIANQYVQQYAADPNSDVNRFVNQMVEILSKPDGFSESDEKLTAVVTLLNDRLSKGPGTRVTEFLKKQVDAQPQQTSTVSDERKQELLSRRSNIANIFKLQNEMLKYYGVTELPADIEVPTVRRGAVGPRVKLNKEYQYFVDGKIRQLSDDEGNKTNPSLSYIATTVTKDLNWKTKELRDYIVENVSGASVSEDGSTVNLPDEWEVMLPAPVNKSLRGVAATVTNSNAVVDDSDDDDDEGNGEESSDFQM